MKSSSRFQALTSGLNSTIVILVLLAVFLGSCNSGTKKAQPASQSDESGVAKFVFSEEIHNFGSLKAGEVVSFTFIFRNGGTKTLTITEVDSGCGCTEVIIPDKSIEPGEEGQIEVIYNTAGEVGKQLKTITLFSNAEQPKMQLFIRANVTNELIELYS
ncbi:MAG: DUF1573 domain-containing protein [Prolixibacteraceae bacterium]|nr:DUF1573 domain-containing protein [Prolixibacteraceae bacterium]